MAYGKRLIPAVIDQIAADDPDRLCYIVPESNFSSTRNVTFKDFSNAIDGMAWWLQANLGIPKERKPLCLICASDLRYFIFLSAAWKAGYKAFFSSPRNNIEAHESLLTKIGCTYLIGDAAKYPHELLENQSFQFTELPGLPYWLDHPPTPAIHYQSSFEEAADEEFLILHSSGSTGPPKPVACTNAASVVFDSFRLLPKVPGRKTAIDEYSNSRAFNLYPPFHAAAIDFWKLSIFYNTVIIFPPANQLPSVGLVNQVLDSGLADCGTIPPAVLEDIVRDEVVLEKLRSWKGVQFGGGPLLQSACETLWKRTATCNTLGSTETSNLPELLPENAEDINYHQYHPSIGFEFEDRGNGLSEMVIVKHENLQQFQAVFFNFPELTRFGMKDLYRPHPTKSNMWMHVGRTDDIIVLSIGEKITPNEVEETVGSLPDVKAALMVGQGRFQPALIIEPHQNKGNNPKSDLLQNVFEKVQNLNEHMPGHAKLDKEHILILNPGTVFQRSPKGSVVRQQTVKNLSGVIDKLYKDAEQQSSTLQLNFENKKLLGASLLAELPNAWPCLESISFESDFYAHGLDSLQTLQITRALRHAASQQEKIPNELIIPQLIYSNPSVRMLAQALLGNSRSHEDPSIEMKSLIERHSNFVDHYHAAQDSLKVSKRDTVILTGSTGGVGSYVLDELLRDPKVKRVYCLNRSKDAESRQRSSAISRGLLSQFPAAKVQFLKVDLAVNNLGLAANSYAKLQQEATLVIHNAWPVSFNRSLSSFAPQIQGCQNLINLALSANNSCRIFFISSVGAANSWNKIDGGSVPEKVIKDLQASEGIGYAQSKHAAELLFDKASQSSGLDVAICRVGQVAGPVLRGSKGQWNKTEWFPSLISSSAHLGKIPSDLGAMQDIDWIPIDILSRVLLGLASKKEEEQASEKTEGGFLSAVKRESKVFHALNPYRAPWIELLPVIQSSLPNATVVSFEDWIKAVEFFQDENEYSGDLDLVPAINLLTFYRSLLSEDVRPTFATDRSRAVSLDLQNLKAVNPTWMELWMKQWGFNESYPEGRWEQRQLKTNQNSVNTFGVSLAGRRYVEAAMRWLRVCKEWLRFWR
ncbi:acetyl-CoA synthetase-like protein [Microthyrium microscopicum]|uniref:Acetyl-CoA synthetase-like protein n=1 Tax=Microthyrium microscopicum TaxID=703497 RepID=A0A6A6U0G4_9PEZI|nr:acetyl-CoA synthetase-like protein [Microthyrium microscopicum]